MNIKNVTSRVKTIAQNKNVRRVAVTTVGLGVAYAVLRGNGYAIVKPNGITEEGVPLVKDIFGTVMEIDYVKV